MGVYRIAWPGALGILTLFGITVAVLSLPGGALCGLGVLAAIGGPGVGAGIYSFTPAPEAATPPRGYLLGVCALTATGVVAVAGLIALFGVVALLIWGLLIACSPALLRAFLARVPRIDTCGPPTDTALTPPAQPPPLPASVLPNAWVFSDAELCWQWRTTFAVLQRTLTPAERLHIVQTRAALLEELGRRDPAGCTRWLGSGARAASDPTRFLTNTHTQRSSRQRHEPGR
jgi:hypothetical protein